MPVPPSSQYTLHLNGVHLSQCNPMSSLEQKFRLINSNCPDATFTECIIIYLHQRETERRIKNVRRAG